MWTDAEADVWLPLTLQQPLRYANNSSSYGPIDERQPWFAQDIAWLNLVARVPGGDVRSVLPGLLAANHEGVVELANTMRDAKGRAAMLAHALAVESFSRGFSGLRARFSDGLFVLTGMVALVLFVTCANVASLLLARAAGQARDLGIRISLGATTGRLVRQYLTDSLALALLGGGLGVFFSRWASRCSPGKIARQEISAGLARTSACSDLRSGSHSWPPSCSVLRRLSAIAAGRGPVRRISARPSVAHR